MKYEFHEYANLFPLIEGEQFEALKADVLENGVREPVWLYQSKILDGRNRYRAAQAAGVDFQTREYTGNAPLAFVVSLNLHRRHLTESQRASVAAKLANMAQGARTDVEPSANLQKVAISQSEAASMLNVSTRSVSDAAKVIHNAAPELVKAMDEGRASVSAAAALLTLPKDEQATVAAGDKKTIQAAAKTAKARTQKPEAVKPAGTPHVLQVINAMDNLARYLQRESMTLEDMADVFMAEVDLSSPAIADRIKATLPVMREIGNIARDLEMAA